MRRFVFVLTLLLGSASLWAQELTLDQCLSYCEEGNRDLRNSSLSMVEAKARLTEARLEFLPRVSANGMAYYAIDPLFKITLQDMLGKSDMAIVTAQWMSAFAEKMELNTSYEAFKGGYGASVMLMQPLYAGGRIFNGNKLASLGVKAARLQNDIAVKAVRDTVENKYWMVVALQEKQGILEETSALLARLEKDLTSALAAGVVTQEDLLQVQFKRKEVEVLARQLNGGLSLTKMDLLTEIGYPFSYLDLPSIHLAGELGQAPALETVLDEDPSMLVTAQSQLLDMQVEARKLEKRMAVGELLPQVAVGGAYGYGALIQSGQPKANGMVFATVQVPLTDIAKAFVRNRRYDARLKMAQNDREYLNSKLQLLEQKLRLDVTTAWDQIQLQEQAVACAENVLMHTEARYKAGQITASTLAQSTVEVSQARNQLIEARITYRKAVNAYRHLFVQ